jgi:hypothetical protein
MTFRPYGTPRAGKALLTNTVEHNIEARRKHSRKIRLIAINMDCAQLPHQVGVSRMRGTPHFAAREDAQRDKGLSHSTGCADDKKVLTLLNAGIAMKQLISGHPTQHE